MSTEYIVGLILGMVSLPFIYWLGYYLAFNEGKRRELRELARMELDHDPNFRLKLMAAQLEIINDLRSKKAYEIE